MDAETKSSANRTIGSRIKRARLESGFTQEELAAPQFTKGYISALERGKVRPSLKALEYIASRLQHPLSHFVTALERSGAANTTEEPELQAVLEDLNYQYNYSRMLIQSGRIDEGFDLIQVAEQSVSSYSRRLPPRLRYRPHFLRGMGYLQRSEPKAAIHELGKSLEETLDDEESEARVHNLLGVALYLQGHSADALKQHLLCQDAISRNIVKDISLQLSILRNLANDYWALNDATQAIGTYEQALKLVDDVDGAGRQAEIHWAIAMAYKAVGDWSQAKLHSTKALHLFELVQDVENSIIINLHLAELFILDGRYDESLELLAKANALITGTGTSGNKVLESMLHYTYADVYRRQKNMELASEHSRQALELVRAAMQESGEEIANLADGIVEGENDQQSSAAPVDSNVKYPPIGLYRAYAEALQAAAQVAEALGETPQADALFERALQLIENTGLVEMAHTIAFSYGEVLAARGDFGRASEQYRKAAKSSAGQVRLPRN
jgi:tetratricopeptide (TPR) repeat protein